LSLVLTPIEIGIHVTFLWLDIRVAAIPSKHPGMGGRTYKSPAHRGVGRGGRGLAAVRVQACGFFLT